jgi:DNA-binding XRE family transcriptional regulator
MVRTKRKPPPDPKAAARRAQGERIAQARRDAGVENVAEFARQCGVSPNTMYRCERGELLPSITTLTAIVRVSGTPADVLLGIVPPVRRAREARP